MIAKKLGYLHEKYWDIFWWRRILKVKFELDETRSMPRSWYYKGAKVQLKELHKDFLLNSGWLESVTTLKPLLNGRPIPWFTYPSIHFLENLNFSGVRYLEIGGGFSSLYFARRGVIGKSYEFDSNWARLLEKTLDEIIPDNNFEICSGSIEITGEASESVLFKALSQNQSELLLNYMKIKSVSKEESIDDFIMQGGLLKSLVDDLKLAEIVVIDGNYRNLICALASQYCNTKSMVILDNSDRSEYECGKHELRSAGWIEFPFHGIGPMNSYSWTTSIWLKELSGSFLPN